MKADIATASDRLTQTLLEKKLYSQACAAATLGASQDTIDSLVKACVNEGWPTDAQKAAALRKPPGLTESEIDALIQNI